MATLSINKEAELSILIVSYNNREDLARCINSVYNYNRDLKFEVIVINNGSCLPIEFKKQFPDIFWIENSKNLGFATAVNQGIKIARARYILCLNSDTVLSVDSLLPLVNFMDKYTKAGAAGGQVLDTQGRLQPTCRRFPTYFSGLFNRTSLLTKLFPHNRFSRRYLLTHWDHKNIRCVDWIAGTYILFRQEAIRDVGYLNEDYFMYCEEIDWCYRAKQKGWKVYYVPQAKLMHNQKNSASTGKKIILHHQSMLKFYKKILKAPRAIQVFLATGVFLKVIVLLLFKERGRAVTVLFKTLKVSKKPAYSSSKRLFPLVRR